MTQNDPKIAQKLHLWPKMGQKWPKMTQKLPKNYIYDLWPPVWTMIKKLHYLYGMASLRIWIQFCRSRWCFLVHISFFLILASTIFFYLYCNQLRGAPNKKKIFFWEISTKSVFLRSRVAACNASQHGRLMVRRQLLLQHKNKTDNNQQPLPLNDHCQM